MSLPVADQRSRYEPGRMPSVDLPVMRPISLSSALTGAQVCDDDNPNSKGLMDAPSGWVGPTAAANGRCRAR